MKATLHGHAIVVDNLLKEGANYGETTKANNWTHTERSLPKTAYKGHLDLVICLVVFHGANPIVDQWPKEMFETQRFWVKNQVRLAKSSISNGIFKWKNVYEDLGVLKLITRHPMFDPTACVSVVFDNKSELQNTEFGNWPRQLMYQYPALSCFVSAGWSDAVEEMLSIKGSSTSYDKEDEVLQYQDKITRHVSSVNVLTRETWVKIPDDPTLLSPYQPRLRNSKSRCNQHGHQMGCWACITVPLTFSYSLCHPERQLH